MAMGFYIREGREREQKKEKGEYIGAKTDERENVRCSREEKNKDGVQAAAKPRISSQYANEEESVLSQNDLDMVSTSGPNKQQEFCNQHAQAGFLGGMLRDGG